MSNYVGPEDERRLKLHWLNRRNKVSTIKMSKFTGYFVNSRQNKEVPKTKKDMTVVKCCLGLMVRRVLVLCVVLASLNKLYFQSTEQIYTWRKTYVLLKTKKLKVRLTRLNSFFFEIVLPETYIMTCVIEGNTIPTFGYSEILSVNDRANIVLGGRPT